MKTLARVSAVLAFLLCLIGGIWVIAKTEDNEQIWIGIGLYLIGKAFFVGPMLLVAAEQIDKPPATK